MRDVSGLLSGYKYVIGIDESGRGSWAGDVFAAATLCFVDQFIEGVKDSKKMTVQQRKYTYSLIQTQVLAFNVARANVMEIDQYNILQATFLAMKRAYESVSAHINADQAMVIIDGSLLPMGLNHKAYAVEKADQKFMSVSAASILAKVDRDLYCQNELNEIYPQYYFGQHKGYGTALHQQQLSQYGPCAAHRQSFKPIAAYSSSASLD